MLFYAYLYEWTEGSDNHHFYVYARTRKQADKKFEKIWSKDILAKAAVTRTNW